MWPFKKKRVSVRVPLNKEELQDALRRVLKELDRLEGEWEEEPLQFQLQDGNDATITYLSFDKIKWEEK